MDKAGYKIKTDVSTPIVAVYISLNENPLMGTGNNSVISNNIKLVHWPLMGGLLHLVQEGGDWSPQPVQALLVVPNVTAHPSTASVPITVLLYNGPLLCGFNVPIKALTYSTTSPCSCGRRSTEDQLDAGSRRRRR